MSDSPDYTSAGDALSFLVLEIFRLNGRLLAAGDRLVAGVGLTSARWQVLGAIDLAPAPAPVAHLARSMGLQRQGVQRIVNELVAEGLVELRPNPNHRRAKLVALSPLGAEAYDAAGRLQRPWITGLAAGFDVERVREARELLATLRSRLEADLKDEQRITPLEKDSHQKGI